ncbi:uncharacterized protein LOC126904157 isoform X2 [Daktulosphaira vitifoliae]|uniref:uncharacterized protein LOC126904157 isoform X2 n=1 Tax=Daktulosphaira vitifoliae TaxID=58002 RepID=UPI0021A9E982|nr:uncharacterized protein LOC126904157 isoform X2 [Daktulosphaira vitifoliae]
METNHSSIISLSSKSLANIFELIKMMTGLEDFQDVYKMYINILNTLHDNHYEYPKKKDIDVLINGIIEKYITHGFPLEAKEFQMRIFWFIDHSDINNYSNESTCSVKWAIISLIIQMAKNPCGFRNALRNTNLDSVRIQLEGESAILGETFKSNIIKELISLNNNKDYVESEESDYEDENDFLSPSVDLSRSISFIDNLSINKNKLLEDNRNEYLKLLYINENKAVKILRNIASESVWSKSNSGILVQGGKYTSHFAIKRFSPNMTFKIICDSKVILDCLNHHLVPSNIFQYNLAEQNQNFGYVNILSTVSPEVFDCWLSTIFPYINKLSELINFTHFIKCSAKVSNTLRAYSNGLEKILTPIVEKISFIENNIKNSTYINYTLISFEEEMHLHFQVILFVYILHTEALGLNWKEIDNWKISTRIISVLFWSIQTSFIDFEKIAVMTLFLYTLEPYMHMTELWIHAGQLVDEHNEFLILNYEGDSCTEFNLYLRDVNDYLVNCGIVTPPIFNVLLNFLKSCDWKVFVASELSNNVETFTEVPRGELFHNFITELKNILNDWDDYITIFKPYNPLNWSQIPMLATYCIDYRFSSNCTSNLTKPSSFEIVDILVFIVQKALDSIGIVVRNIILKKNKCINHLKTLYNIIFLEEVTKTVTIDRTLEYKIEQNLFLNNCFYSLISEDHSSMLSISDHSCNLSLNYKNEKHSLFREGIITSDNFADELERLTITYDVKFPLSLILTNGVINSYNKIFRLLITVKQAVEMISQLQTKDLKKYNYSLDVRRLYFIRLWILSTTYKLQTYFFSVASKYLGSKLFDNFEKVKNGLEGFEMVLETHISLAIKMCMLEGLMEKLSFQSLSLLWNACEQFTILWKKSSSADYIDTELMEKIEQEYVDSCWKLASSLDTYLVAENDSTSLLYQFCQDFMSSMPTKESADLDGSMVYRLSDSQNRYSFIYT